MKLTELMATMGGFIKALLLAGFILANPISKLSLKTELVNRLFNFEGDDKDEDENKNEKQEDYRLSRGFSKAELRTTKQNLNENQDVPINQIQLNFMKNNSKPYSQVNSRNVLKEGPPITYTESLNTTAAQPMLTTYPSNLQHQGQNNAPNLQKNLSQPRMNQLNLLKIQRRKNQSLNDLSTIGLNYNQSKKSMSPMHTQNQLSLQKDKVKLVRTMLKSYVSQHSMKPEDCMKASTILGAHKKEDPDAVFKKLFKSNEKTLTMKLWDYLKYFLGLKKEVKNKQIKFSMRKVNERLDIVFIMKKLIEVDKMKMLFLNENQRKIFEYLPRPIVRLDPDQQQEEAEQYTLNQAWARQMFFNDKNYISKASEAMLAYQEIIEKGKALDPMDKKLIEMLDESKKLYFQVDSPTYSPNGRIKRSSLSVINSINHSPKKKQENTMFLKGLQNISPAESIELNEKDIQEMKFQEQNQGGRNSPQKVIEQRPDSLLHRYDNTRCFNKRNTMHFMKQRTLQFGDLPSEQDHQNSDQLNIPPPTLNERNNETINKPPSKQEKFDKILDGLYQQQHQQNQFDNKILNGKSYQEDEENNQKQQYQADTGQFISQQSSYQQQQQYKQASASSIKAAVANQHLYQQQNYLSTFLNIPSTHPESFPKIPITDDMNNEIDMPKNTVKTPKCGLFNQFFSPKNTTISPKKIKKQDSQIQNSDDTDLNIDYDNCPSLGEEKARRQEVKDTQMHPSCYHQSHKLSNSPNNLEQQMSQNTFNPSKDYKLRNNDCHQSDTKHKKHKIKRNPSISQMIEDSGNKFNDSIQMDQFGGLAGNKEQSLLNISIEPFTRYAQPQFLNGCVYQKNQSPENTSV